MLQLCMEDVVLRLEKTYFDQFERLAQMLRQQYPSHKFNAYRYPVKWAAECRGHHVGIDCVLSDTPLEQPDKISLLVELSFSVSGPKVMADVGWGHPGGAIEASFYDDWRTSNDWPPVTEAVLQELDAAMPRLLRSFVEAVARGHPNS